MKLDIQRSIIFDVISFFDIYFNYDFYSKEVRLRKLDEEKSFLFYNLIKKFVSVNDDLCSLFSLNGNKNTLCMRYLLYKFDKAKTLNDFIRFLKDDEFKQYIQDYYFSEYENNEITRKEIYNLDDIINPKVKISLAIIFTDYKSIIATLEQSILEVANIILELQKLNHNKINQFHLGKDHIKILQKKFNYIFTDNTIYCVSLVAPYSVNYTFFGEIYYWIFGIFCHISIEKETEFKYII